ncbi:uncharacterized protein TM35_000091410 [Trypanosoma theileri]|uniref:C2 domain-containing protein n=1 Tax=Trypanosoma theileri TaxID=67003 RepID=A0A1X0NZR4_9TRYP|nr:uncharacterized protein TM35_000091410 [Trypanosoma theileri]ORC90091.1 hypothetical protein TM35_000091410 [Trypanosoma theileri]
MPRPNEMQLSAAREDRLQRALHENHRLKREVLELQDKLKLVQVKFHKVTRDLKRVSPEVLQELENVTTQPSLPHTLPPPSTLHSTRPHSSSGALPQGKRTSGEATSGKRLLSTSLPPLTAFEGGSAPSAADVEELQRCREALQRAQMEIASLRAAAQTVAVTSSSASPAVTLVLDQLRQDLERVVTERDRLNRECDTLREQLGRTQAELNNVRYSHEQQRSFEKQSYDVLSEKAKTVEGARIQSEIEYQKIIDALTQEKDALALKLRLMLQEEAGRQHDLALVDPVGLIQLQSDIQDKSKQITILTSRMQGAQQQVETLKGECNRLVEELQRFHSVLAETKRQLFEVEHEKSILQVRCARMEELEEAFKRKSEEIIRLEQELLRTAGTLQSCNRETEEAVRRELSTRIVDLQEMRDSAESRRREKESQLLEAQHQLAELRRQLEVARGDAQMYREQLQKAEKERMELSRHAALAGHTVEEFGEEDVHRALAVAAVRKAARGTGTTRTKTLTTTSTTATEGARGKGIDEVANRQSEEAQETLDMWEALQWDEGWEADQLREALASAALDMELASTRCAQMSEQIEHGRKLQQELAKERDTLLEENIEMRRRLTHVQTVFAKQQLEAYRVAKLRGSEEGSIKNAGLITFNIRDLECDAGLLRALGISDPNGAAVALFFSLDGLKSYDTMLSPTFYSLDEPLDITFRYDHMERDEITLSDIRNTTFIFQLHQVHGATNTVIAMAELPGVALLSCRELTVSERIVMLSGNGEPSGAISIEMCASNLMLPILLNRPLLSETNENKISSGNDNTDMFLTSEALRAALISLRSVVALRVQVFRADGLLAPPTPQPYVFYTASAPSGLSCVRDTVVRTSTKAFTTDPVFDVDPVDHRLVVDRELVQFVAEGVIVFVVFDEQAKEVRANLGVVEVPLRPLLASPQAVVRTTEVLHPQGTLSVGLSWVCRA